MKKIAFSTLGCKVNQADTASMEKLFRQAGYELVAFNVKADIYLINTCVVTNMGQKKSRQVIHRAVRQNPEALIVVTGCYPQTAADEVKAISGVDLIIGNQDRAQLVTLVEKALMERRGSTMDGVHQLTAQTAFEELPADEATDKTRAFLKIQEGCNQYCTYCIIPYARGPLRSRSLTNIKTEVTRLVAAGFKEIVLIGIHLGAYGQETVGGATLTTAVKTVLAVPGVERLRLGSLESVEVADELLEVMLADERVCRQLHLPLQAGCDEILQLMHRPYDTAKFSKLLQKIRQTIPEIAITTDIIVGFPGETAEHFAATKAFATQCQFSKIHIFPFSPRQGTPAASYAGVVPENLKQERATQLAAVDANAHAAFCQTLVGHKVQVLFEQAVAPNLVEGLSSNYIRVFAPGAASLNGQIRTVAVQKVYQDGVYGEIQ